MLHPTRSITVFQIFSFLPISLLTILGVGLFSVENLQVER